jgi:[histone H3]-trimethyl-L-lysine4 demethylase
MLIVFFSIIDSLKEMITREQKDRQAARAMGLAEVLELEDRPEEQYQCAVCKAFCYLSQITCPCTTKVVCVEHFDLLCERPRSHLSLRKRFSDDELVDLLAKVSERAHIPNAWLSKYNKSLMEVRPSLRSLRALLAEGDRINFPLKGLSHLRRYVARANEWVDAANSFTVRKQSRKRVKRGRGRPSLASQAEQVLDEVAEKPDRTLEELYALLEEVETFGFECPEIDLLRGLARSAEKMKNKAGELLAAATSNKDRDEFISQCKSLLIDGSSLNVQIDELSEVEKIVDREQLISDLEEKLESTLTLSDAKQLLERCRTCYLDSTNEHFRTLEGKVNSGEDWESRAKAILATQVKTIGELEEFSNVQPDVPVDPTLLDRLSSARAKAKDFEKQANAWIRPESPTLPRAQDVLRLVSRAEKDYSIDAIDRLKDLATIALDIESRAEHALKLRYRFDSDEEKGEDTFAVMQKWLRYANDNLNIFSIPAIRKLGDQLDAHNKWLRSLPWWNEEQQRSEGVDVLRDVLASTNQQDDNPPNDMYMTCICDRPVYPPPPGQSSDAVQCDHCFARFHGVCARNGGSCPFCDHHHWNGEISKKRHWHFCFLPRHLETAPEISRHYSQEYKNLQVIVHRVDRLVSVIGQFLTLTSQTPNQHPDYIVHVRHYMRKLYRMQFPISPNPDVSFGLDLAGLHRILAARPPTVRPKKKRRSRFTFGQDIDNDWADGTRCICRGRTPYLLHYRAVSCENCLSRYHATCVFYPQQEARPFLCPLCCLRKAKSYAYAEIRVTNIGKADILCYSF